ncbi:peptidase, M50 family [Filimonas lacunae]|nr:peptidase, M50 family [Filimonas lacunae]
MYQINAFLYQVLLHYKKGYSSEAIASEMSILYKNASFNAATIETHITTALATVSATNKAGDPADEYVSGKITIVPEGAFTGLYRILSALLFHRIVFPVLFVVAVVVSLFFFYNQHLYSFANLWNQSVSQLAVGNIILVYGIFLFICLWHELGHATASWKYGVQPREIGFGFYFVFPVFYANVSGIWQLPAARRNVVNMGGIYFQLLVNLICIVAYSNHIYQPLLRILIITNTVSIVCSLVPFFRYDGYWVFSDYFNIPNLKSRSTALATDLLFSGIGKWRQLKGSLPLVLIFYTVTNVFFWLFVYAEVVVLIIRNTRALVSTLQQGSWLYIPITLPGIITAVSTVVTLWMLVFHFIHLSKLLGNERRKIPGTVQPAAGWHIA